MSISFILLLLIILSVMLLIVGFVKKQKSLGIIGAIVLALSIAMAIILMFFIIPSM